MTAGELQDQLKFLGLSVEDLAALTGTELVWCRRLVAGAEPIPHWMNVLTVFWSYYEEALQIARGMSKDAP
jgi:hypothetical protein